MRSLLLALLAVPVLLGANQAHALNLCARIDQATGEPRDGASIRFRVECRKGEASFGTAADLAMIRANRADLDDARADIDAALGAGEPARIAAARPATTASASSRCGLTVTAGNAVFNACNVHVRSGSGSTSGTINGLGNLIVGYDEASTDDKTGSHNLIVGPYHSYTSYGGFIAGYNNAANGSYSSVSGGYYNTASGYYSSVSGGYFNTASGYYSSVSGGYYNTASNYYSSVSGGYNNTASGYASSVSGGHSNEASYGSSSVSGGYGNEASSYTSSVSGGYDNEASGSYSSVLGGQSNTASADYSIAP